MVEPAGIPPISFGLEQDDTSRRAALLQQSMSCLYEKNIVSNPTTARILLMFLRDFVDSHSIYAPWPQPCFCPMMKCHDTFTEPLSLIQHLLFCQELSRGEFECWKCRTWHGFPTNEKDWANWTGWTPHRMNDCPKSPSMTLGEASLGSRPLQSIQSRSFLQGEPSSATSLSGWGHLASPVLQSQHTCSTPDVFVGVSQEPNTATSHGMGLSPTHTHQAVISDLQTEQLVPWHSVSISEGGDIPNSTAGGWSVLDSNNLATLVSPTIQYVQGQATTTCAPATDGLSESRHSQFKHTLARHVSDAPIQSIPLSQISIPYGAFSYPALSPFTPPPASSNQVPRPSEGSGHGHGHSSTFWSSSLHGQPPFAAIRASRALTHNKKRKTSAMTRPSSSICSSPILPPSTASSRAPSITGSARSIFARTRPTRNPLNYGLGGLPGYHVPTPVSPLASNAEPYDKAPSFVSSATSSLSSPRHSDAISIDTTIASSIATADSTTTPMAGSAAGDDGNDNDDDADEELKCDLCDWKPRGVKENLKGYLRKHKNNHRGLRYPCEILGCKKTFSRLDNLKKHIKDKHGIDVTTGGTLPVVKRRFSPAEGKAEDHQSGATPSSEAMVMTIPKRPREGEDAGLDTTSATSVPVNGQRKVLPQHMMLWHM